MDCLRRNLVGLSSCSMDTLWLEREHPNQLGYSLHMHSSVQSARQRGQTLSGIPSGFRSLYRLVASLLGMGGSRDVHCTDCNYHHDVPLDYSQSLWPLLRKTRRGLECRFSCQGPSSVQIAGKFRLLSVDHSSAMRVLSNYPTRVMQSLQSERKSLPRLPKSEMRIVALG